MLHLKNIVKTYTMGDLNVEALNGVSLAFRKNDFVSVLGPSGCGKTTLLNIIGGLDRYTSGDLVINGISTREYKDVDWDIYRNNSIGFVFQSYNLIPHQTAFANVELALTLAGESPAERKKRVLAVLHQVGLGDQIYKKPTQMSGGQMQRVAIARALVNNPDILLADEPTGALDSETSLQIMELLKDIAKDRLVIMVTHNAEIAESYSTRIIRLFDGRVTDDSHPYTPEGETRAMGKTKRKKISMSFMTALSLSFKNLMTKKTRTILTAFAGSIGIIGIALILSLSSGMQAYISNLERDTMSTYPLELESQTMDMSSMILGMMSGHRSNRPEGEQDRVYANSIMTNMIESMTARVKKNDLRQLKQHIESDAGKGFYDAVNTIQYGYSVELHVYSPDTSKGIVQINPSTMFSEFGMGETSGAMSMSMGMGNYEIWTEMLSNEDLLRAQYDVIAGDWPRAYNEIVLIVDEDNELSDVEMYSLGLMDQAELDELMKYAIRGEKYERKGGDVSFSFDEILSLSYKLLLTTDYFEKDKAGWVDKRGDEAFMIETIENALDLTVVGILRPTENAAAVSIGGAIGYTAALTDYVIEAVRMSDIGQAQLAEPDINVFTGRSFDAGDQPAVTMEDVMAMMAELPEAERAQMQAMLSSMPEEQIMALVAARAPVEMQAATSYEENLQTLGIVDFDSPSVIRLFPKDFDSKKQLETLIADYNSLQEAEGNDEFIINYTDIVGMMTSSISNVIDIISYVLIAFVAISLVVSSIMIAIITYISVLERTKEIGILRSIGASKKDITRVFNAETFIEGLVAGGMGILITLLLNIPINSVIKSLTGISNISVLPVYGAVSLIVISMLLTVVAGFIPSKMAAKKDPVVALRTE